MITVERDAALERRFQPVMVNEPSVEETILILHGLLSLRAPQAHNLRPCHRGCSLSLNRYISDRFLPDKAIDLIDEAGSRVRIINSKLSSATKELNKERQVLNQKTMLYESKSSPLQEKCALAN